MPPGLRLTDTLQGADSRLYRFQWSADGAHLALPAADGTIAVWNVPTRTCLHSLRAHTDQVFAVAWSPDGKVLASSSRDRTVRLWDVPTGQTRQVIRTDENQGYSLLWSPDGTILASASHENDIWLIDPAAGQVIRKLSDSHAQTVHTLAWSPDSGWLASGSIDQSIRVWDAQTGVALKALEGHTGTVYALAWSPDGTLLVSGSGDKTIRVWDVWQGQQKLVIEGHTNTITALSFSSDGRVMASRSGDDTVRLWRCDTWETIAVLPEPAGPSDDFLETIAFHPSEARLATLAEGGRGIRLWAVNIDALLKQTHPTHSVRYANAKVVIVGDTGVGKSGLSLVLAGQPYQRTESTHNRQVYVLDSQEIAVDGVNEQRETLLWDLAGQPGYRLIHQLHLSDVAVALVVFDARNEVDPFSGVFHWVRALRQAYRLRGDQSHPLRILLVAARVDRGTVGVSKKRLEQVIDKLKLDGYFETSAKEGWQIAELAHAIRAAIDWDTLPRVSSTELFMQIRDFLTASRTTGLCLASQETLYYTFLQTSGLTPSDILQAQFETCIGLVASRGLVEKLSFADLVLLQPELLDSYASALVNAARSEPDGLGYIREDDALAGRFPMPKDDRLKSQGQEKLLLIATIERLLRYEIALRVQSDDTSYLVFPSQLTREYGDMPQPQNLAVKFTFEGPILNIYATLVVRLVHRGLFKLRELWKNAAIFSATPSGSACGLIVREVKEGQAELTLFYDKNPNLYARYQFEEYIHAHLKRRSLPHRLVRTDFIICPHCHYLVPEDVVALRKERQFNWLDCPVCGSRLSLTHPKDETITSHSAWIMRMNQIANSQRDRAAAISTLDGKIATGDYDVFLCHNHGDKPLVKKIGIKLKEYGLLPWLDEWELQPGVPWQKLLEQQIQKVRAVAVFVGDKGLGPWQDMEQAAFIREFVKRGCPVIPVVLPNCRRLPDLPLFLAGMTWVDFRKPSPEPLRQLMWGITGKRPASS